MIKMYKFLDITAKLHLHMFWEFLESLSLHYHAEMILKRIPKQNIYWEG